MIYDNIKYILFDSGRTLNEPITNDWFLTPNFYNIIQVSNYQPDDNKIMRAIEKEKSYIDSVKYIPTIEEEHEMFREYYKRVLLDINYPYIEDRMLSLLADDNIYNDNKVSFFEDVRPGIERLKNKYKLGVVSDTWPSLKRIYVNYGIEDCFSDFFITSMLGYKKSDNILFKIILDNIGLKPEEVALVDAREQFLDIASEYGMYPILINRTRDVIKSKYPIISTLDDLV